MAAPKAIALDGVMAGGQRACSPAAFRMLFRTCPDCHAAMRLWRIEPKLMEQRVDTHFFECDRCGSARSEDIARPPLNS